MPLAKGLFDATKDVAARAATGDGKPAAPARQRMPAGQASGADEP